MNKRLQILQEISVVSPTKLLLLIIDGLGGVPHLETGLTELETANMVNIDNLAKKSLCGVTVPVFEGITPGSAPGHLAIFGYDPTEYQIGRGILEAFGLGIELNDTDVCARCNFATFDYENNIIIDRRAGRISTEKNLQITTVLQKNINKVDDVKITIKTAKEHRFVVVFSGDGLSERITENDPLKDNLKPKEIVPLEPGAKKMADITNRFLRKSIDIIREFKDANYILMRGFSKIPDIPKISDIYKINPAAIATYPMYKGLARLVGMQVLTTGDKIQDQIDTLKENFKSFDFFYFHIKQPDSLGEDGNFSGKVKKLEEIDSYIPQIIGLGFDVIIITGDHSTPAVLKSHSWHFVPVLIFVSNIKYKNRIKKFTEEECLLNGNLGKVNATDVLLYGFANAFKLSKYGP